MIPNPRAGGWGIVKGHLVVDKAMLFCLNDIMLAKQDFKQIEKLLFSRQEFNDYIDRMLKIIREIREINRSFINSVAKQAVKNQ